MQEKKTPPWGYFEKNNAYEQSKNQRKNSGRTASAPKKWLLARSLKKKAQKKRVRPVLARIQKPAKDRSRGLFIFL